MTNKNYKLLIVSDSHGDNSGIKEAIKREMPFDVLVHCGDIEGSVSRMVEPDATFEIRAVRGNCDFSGALPNEDNFKVGFCNIFVTHGDDYNVKYDMDLIHLKKAAKKRMADVVLFGHSHHAEIVRDSENGLTLINPGSIGNPRTSAQECTYATLVITEDYEVIPEIKVLE